MDIVALDHFQGLIYSGNEMLKLRVNAWGKQAQHDVPLFRSLRVRMAGYSIIRVLTTVS